MTLVGEVPSSTILPERLALAAWCQALDAYQGETAQLERFDENGVTVNEQEQARYYLQGMREEFYETWEADCLHPTYDRLRILQGTVELIRLARADTAPNSSLDLHRKEFGDISWYVARFLSLHDIRLSDAVDASSKLGDMFAAAVDRPSSVGTSKSRVAPLWREYVVHARALFRAAEDTVWNASPENHYWLKLTAGNFLISMDQLLCARLDTDLLHVMADNVAKLKRRDANGTIFGNGDSR